jgi:osmoprotectant transport system substrate-binding protein/osmoprotectant transport system permease protein
MTIRSFTILTIVLIVFAVLISASTLDKIKIGSKKFTESVILGEIASLNMESEGFEVTHVRQLGGSRLLFNALIAGDIDIYPEYSGTIKLELLKNQDPKNSDQIVEILEQSGIKMTAPLGFNNTYAIGVLPETAAKLNLSKISDLINYPELKIGLTNEFLERGDGWPGLKKVYKLPQRDVTGLDHDLAYRALENGNIDIMNLYSTDAEIPYYGLKILEDDMGYFPEYYAVYLYRTDLEKRFPQAVKALLRLEGKFNEKLISDLNRQVKLDQQPESTVASGFLKDTFGVEIKGEVDTVWSRVTKRSIEHLYLVIFSMILGIITALPLGILAYKYQKVSNLILGGVGVIQTIPSLALLVFMIPLMGISAPPAIAALFLYSLLPMVRNTHTGLISIPDSLRESADALGLPSKTILLKIELPLASRSILSGVKTSFIITIGFATLGALIGAGGYGQPILTGIRLDNYGLILEGAIPAAVMALVFQWLFDGLEYLIVPKGIRQKVS